MKKRLLNIAVLLFVLSIVNASQVKAQNNLSDNQISIKGIWKFRLDPLNIGIQEKGVLPKHFSAQTILLPGSIEQMGYGIRNNEINSLRLTRLFPYKGAAWYQKKIFVPANWKNKEVHLFLERAHWQTQVWINDHKAGKRESLAAPHVYNITSFIKPGEENIIRIRVDNNKMYDIGSPHAISEETQTNWNGIIGKMQLRAYDKVHIKDVQVYPDVENKQIKVKITIANKTNKPANGILLIKAKLKTKGAFPPVTKQIHFSGSDSLIIVNTVLFLGEDVKLWDEFHPHLYQLFSRLTVWNRQTANAMARDIDSVTFGMREFSTKETQFVINGRPTFIRANINSAGNPITGYPAMDVKHWMRVFKICKQYGLNAMRFHTWCPPEAVFKAADRMGFYLQIENADWRFNIGKDPAANHFLAQEADRILKTYGNHPSFMMFCEGNELVGPERDSFLTALIRHWKEEDPRHLYTGSSGYPVIANDDYIDLYGPRAQHWKEGLKGRLNAGPYHTDFDYSDVVAKYNKPVISHEVGQWCVYPDFNQIIKYTGVLKPYNYALFRESLRDHHMLDQAKQLTMASGKFQVIQKKEELETLLRTPGLGGYQLLQLQDFPGQGTAPVGVVDQFWDPKPYVTAKEFREFQSACVLLLRAPDFIFTNNEIFHATAEIANYSEGEMKNAVVHWQLKFPDGRIYEEGNLPETNIPVGNPFPLGKISIPLTKIKKATRLDLILSVKDSDVTNHWSIWVYPKTLPHVNRTFQIFHTWNEDLKKALQKGENILLLADTAKIHSNLSPSFSGISWNTVWSGTPPDKLGILCDPGHPALKHFPTQYYSNWQWWDIVRHSRPINMNDLPATFRPIVQMIPDWNKNNKIGLIFEAKVGNGNLLITSIDLIHNMDKRPVARQLLYSLEKYINSEHFNPKKKVLMRKINLLFKK